MKRLAAYFMAVLLAAFSFNSAPLALGGQQSTKPVTDARAPVADRASPVEADPQDPQTPAQLPAGLDNPFRRDAAPEIKPYDKVITKDAKFRN